MTPSSTVTEAGYGDDPVWGWLDRDCIRGHAQAHADLTACIDLQSGRSLTYRELDREIACCAAYLKAVLSGPGARVSILARNSLSHVALFYACARTGMILQPLNWRLSGAELGPLLADAGPELFIYQTEFETEAAQAMQAWSPALVLRQAPGEDPLRAAFEAHEPFGAAPIDPDAPFTLLYTSGTTGRPKGCIMTVKGAFMGAYNNRMAAEMTPASVMLCDSPMFHVIGLIANLHAVMQVGGRLLIADRFQPGTTLRWIGDADTPITHYFCVPQMAQALRDDPAYASTDFSRLRAIFTGGAPMPQPLTEAFAADGVLALDSYGLTETCGGVFGQPLDLATVRAKLGTCGTAVPAIEVRLVTAQGKDAAVGEVGEIWLRGPSISPGYWNQPETTAAARTDGWFRTGDAARVDADGFHQLVDRWKDMYITGGENVYPAEVEAVLGQIEGVAEVAVIGVPHPQWGETGCAYVALRAGAALDEAMLIAFCAQRLARYKRPGSVRFIEALPRTASGKILKEQLRRAFAAERDGMEMST